MASFLKFHTGKRKSDKEWWAIEVMKNNGEKAKQIDREIRSDIYKKVDDIARIVDPSAFCLWKDGTSLSAETVDSLRQDYMRARAERIAYDILVYLGIAGEIPWEEIISRMEK